MNPFLLNWGPLAVIVGGYLLGFYFQNSRTNEVRLDLNKRIDDLRDGLRAEMRASHAELRAEIRAGDAELRAEIRASHAEMMAAMEKNHSEMMMKFIDLDHRLGRMESERRILQG